MQPSENPEIFKAAVQDALALVRTHGDRSLMSDKGAYPIDALIVCWYLKLTGNNNHLLDFTGSKAEYDAQEVLRLYRGDMWRPFITMMARLPRDLQPSSLAEELQWRRPDSDVWGMPYPLAILLEAISN